MAQGKRERAILSPWLMAGGWMDELMNERMVEGATVVCTFFIEKRS